MKQTDNLKEFLAFLKSHAEPGPALDRAILTRIQRALHPSRSWTMAKVLLFHVVGSLATLALCPQYGLSLVESWGVLPDLMMEVHPALCFFGCGLMWMVGGQALSYRFLTIDEKRVLGNSRWGMALTITLLSILFFACVGSLDFDLWLGLWILGALSVSGLFNWRITAEQRRFRVAA